MKVLINYTVQYQLTLDVDPDSTLEDAIMDIEIPENDSRVVEDSFYALSAFELEGENESPVGENLINGHLDD